MEERTAQAAPAERPLPDAGREDSPPGSANPPHLADPRALTILTTEHWSLLSARSLVYNEAFARAGMFLTFLTGSLVALGFVAQGSGFNREFLVVAAGILAFDLVIGLTTLGRIISAGNEEFRALQGMTRIRHAYVEMVPTLEPYLSASWHDDAAGILDAYESPAEEPLGVLTFLHGLTTAPGMVGLICSAVAGALAASLVLLAGGNGTAGVVAGIVGTAAMFVLLSVTVMRTVERAIAALEIRFPRNPPGPAGPAPPL